MEHEEKTESEHRTPVLCNNCNEPVMYVLGNPNSLVIAIENTVLLDGSHPKQGDTIHECPHCGDTSGGMSVPISLFCNVSEFGSF